MRLLIITESLYGGGAERISALWSNLLAKQHEVYLLTYYRLPVEYDLSPEVHRLSLLEKEDEYSRNRFTRIFVDSRRVRKVINDIRPDLIIPFAHIMCITASKAAKGLPVKVVHTIRNNPWLEPHRFLTRSLRDKAIKKDGAVIVQNDEQLAYFRAWKKVKTMVVPNLANERCLKAEHMYRPRITSFISAGRLVPQKNQKMAIDALEIAAKDNPDITLSIYGDGPLCQDLKDYANAKGLSSKVFIKGNTANIFQEMNESDVFLMSSDFEGFPNALLEAMAIGLPCISTSCDTGPKSLIQNGANGFLVPVGDAAAMAEKMKLLIGNPARAEAIGKLAKTTTRERFSSEMVAQALENALREMSNALEEKNK